MECRHAPRRTCIFLSTACHESHSTWAQGPERLDMISFCALLKKNLIVSSLVVTWSSSHSAVYGPQLRGGRKSWRVPQLKCRRATTWRRLALARFRVQVMNRRSPVGGNLKKKCDSLESGGAGTWRLQIPSIVETFEMIRCSEEASFVNSTVTTRIIDWRTSENALRALSCAGGSVKHAMQRASKTSVSWRK